MTTMSEALEALLVAEAKLRRVERLLTRWEGDLYTFPEDDPSAIAARAAVLLCRRELAVALDGDER